MDDASPARERPRPTRRHDLTDVVLGAVRPERAHEGRRAPRGIMTALGEVAARVADRRASAARHDARSVLLLALVVAILVGAASWVAAAGVGRERPGTSGGRVAASAPGGDMDPASAPDRRAGEEPAVATDAAAAGSAERSAPVVATRAPQPAGVELGIAGIVPGPIGSGGAPTVRVSIDASNPPADGPASIAVLLLIDGEVVGTQRVDSAALRRGAASASFSLAGCEEGSHQAVAIVDPAGEVAEGRERDNVRMRELVLTC